jgi:hypothetical protein
MAFGRQHKLPHLGLVRVPRQGSDLRTYMKAET